MIAWLLVQEYETANIQTAVLGEWHVLQVTVKPSKDILSFPAVEDLNNRECTCECVDKYIFISRYILKNSLFP